MVVMRPSFSKFPIFRLPDPARAQRMMTYMIRELGPGFLMRCVFCRPFPEYFRHSSYGPDQGESHDDLSKRFPAPVGISAIKLDENGFLWIARDKFHDAFVHDVSASEARILAAVQKPVAKKTCFGVPVTAAAWKSKPSWMLISTEDRLINPDLQRSWRNGWGQS
jgi:hypothetical protein